MNLNVEQFAQLLLADSLVLRPVIAIEAQDHVLYAKDSHRETTVILGALPSEFVFEVPDLDFDIEEDDDLE